MNSATIESHTDEIKKFTIKEYAIGDVYGRHHFHYINDTVDVYKNQQAYSSYFLHSQEIIDYYKKTFNREGKNTLEGYVGCVFADELKIDIDEKEKSLDEVRKLLKKWESSYDLDLRYVRVNFSGSKGFHIRIPSVLFDEFEPSVDLPSIHKQIAKELTFGVTIDEGVYYTVGLFREVNSVNNKSGLFAIPLTNDELFTLSYDEIKELARDQREVNYIDVSELMPVDALVELKENASKEKTDVPISDKPKDSIWDSAPEGERNVLLGKRLGRLVRSNLSNSDIMQLGLILNNQNDPPEDEKLVEKQIQNFLNKYGNIEGDFWKISRKYKDKKLYKIDVEINEKKYIDFLNSEGFAKIYLDKYPLFIKAENNIIKEYSTPMIKDHVMDYVGRLIRAIPIGRIFKINF